ncbi:MAG: protein kinase domain-containing protein [Polyangiaceae bacterium]
MGELQLGTVVAERYRLERLLGEGGMGVVYAATHTKTRKIVALKILRPSLAEDKATKQRFLREARASCAVHHPNVVEIHDVLELADGTAMMVMDMLEGESLASKLDREKKIAVKELTLLLLPVISAVGTAHEVGIVHRDLKPENIFLDKRRGTIDVRVLDFGIAKLTATEGDAARTGAITGTGAVLGTPYYMSPEQIFGEKDIDHRADVWAMGVILYECLAGVRPTQAENIGQIFKIVTTVGIKPIETHVPDLDPPLAKLIARMLSRDRDSRPADLREVASVLGTYAKEQSPAFGAPRTARTSVDPLAESDPSVAAAKSPVVVTPSGPKEKGGELDDTVEEPKDRDVRASTQSPITLSNRAKRGVRRVWPIGVAVAVAVLALGLGLRSATKPEGAIPQTPTLGTTAPRTVLPPPASSEPALPVPAGAVPSIASALPMAVSAAPLPPKPPTSASSAGKTAPPATPRHTELHSASSPAPSARPTVSAPVPAPPSAKTVDPASYQ